MKLTRECKMCREEVTFEVPLKGYIDWYKKGVLIQNAMPDVHPKYREMLVTGTCSNCFDDLFPPTGPPKNE